MEKQRCAWCTTDTLYTEYHDTEWGVPQRDSKKLFEFFILDGAQAGLSWLTILRRRESYRAAFNGFDPERIARYTEKDKNRLLNDEGIIRNRLKIDSAIKNAQCFLNMQQKGEDFSQWLWSWVNNKTVKNKFESLKDIPASTNLSVEISKALKERGFTFVGPTIVYAVLQSAGLVNDHLVSCFRYNEV
ncbi:MAG: DNA-3-methyladenine glycosylase I [Spirochaetaceae bacterium]|jgi:DNA-3-methyladenine glycosylase I|nr:DNA-3-methyladenine glycosylase I [Spirochaetaceae bacterium]